MASESSLSVSDRFLFRGVSTIQHRSQTGLTPKKPGPFREVVTISDDDPLPLDGSWTVGESEQNAVRLHEWKQAGLPTAGVSTTPHRERATFYACSGRSESTGFVYRIDRASCAQLGVREYVVGDHVASPSVPEDNEVILVAADGGVLPQTIIAEVIECSRLTSA